MLDLDQPLNQADFGSLVGISQQAVSDLQQRGVLTRGCSAREGLLSYARHLREVAAGRSGNGDLNLVRERARLAMEQADRIAMKNAQARRELAPVSVIEDVVASVGTQIAGVLDAVPVELKRRLPGVTVEMLELIQAELVKARNLAAGITVDWDAVHEPERDSAGGDAGPGDAEEPGPD